MHKKSVLPNASELLTAAHERGAELLWERYERQLPLCAFTGNGLNCRKCFQGPCRINPFGDEPSRGVCGADRDQIVMETLFQATLEGVLESARTVELLAPGTAEPEFPDIGPALPRRAKEGLSKTGLLPVRKADLFGVTNGFFTHKGFLSQTLRDLTRLGLIHYGILTQGASALNRLSAKGPFHADGINILVVGQASAELLRAIERQAGQRTEGRRINLLVQGAHRLPGTRAVADHGSPELALGMNVDALVVTPNASWPGVETLAAKYGVPVVLLDGRKAPGQTASEAIDQAVRHAQTAFYGAASHTLRPGGAEASSVLLREQELTRALRSGRVGGAVVLYGEPLAKQAFFERTLALMEAAVARRALVLLGGDLGSAIDELGAELDRRDGGRVAAFAAALQQDGLSPVMTFGSAFELPRLVSLLGGDGPCPTVFAFPEFYRTSTWATAVSLLSVGCTVQVGTRLPFWGSPALTEAITGEWQRIAGATLLAAPALPDVGRQAEEVAAHLAAGRDR
jgi:hypothetical protein